ncbi:hypothetical protein B0H19DRAFT_1275101 [Mycena capillaripes]|nr:hypothetical protein B0H19DRAFT_1275101 [Mycena capillaripes]
MAVAQTIYCLAAHLCAFGKPLVQPELYQSADGKVLAPSYAAPRQTGHESTVRDRDLTDPAPHDGQQIPKAHHSESLSPTASLFFKLIFCSQPIPMCAGRCFLFVCSLLSAIAALPPRLSDTSELRPTSIAGFSEDNDGTGIISALSSSTTVIAGGITSEVVTSSPSSSALSPSSSALSPSAPFHTSPPGPSQSAHHRNSSSLAIILTSVFLILLCTAAVVVGCLSCRRARLAPRSRDAQRATIIAVRPRYRWFVRTSASSASSVATMTTAAPPYTPRPPSYASAARTPWTDTASVQTDDSDHLDSKEVLCAD